MYLENFLWGPMTLPPNHSATILSTVVKIDITHFCWNTHKLE